MKPNPINQGFAPIRDEAITNPLNTKNINYQFSAIPNVVLLDHTLSHYAKLIYCVGFIHLGPDHWSMWPSHKRLARVCGISEKTVERYVKELLDRGLWRKKERWLGSERQTNLYSYIHPDAIYGHDASHPSDGEVAGGITESVGSVIQTQPPASQRRRNKTESYQEQGNKKATSVPDGSGCSISSEVISLTHGRSQEAESKRLVDTVEKQTPERRKKRLGKRSKTAPEHPALADLVERWKQYYSERRTYARLRADPASDPKFTMKCATWRKMLRGLLERGEEPQAIKNGLYRALITHSYPYDWPGAFEKQYSKIADLKYDLQKWGSWDLKCEIEARRRATLAEELPRINERARRRAAQAQATGDFLP